MVFNNYIYAELITLFGGAAFAPSFLFTIRVFVVFNNAFHPHFFIGKNFSQGKIKTFEPMKKIDAANYT